MSRAIAIYWGENFLRAVVANKTVEAVLEMPYAEGVGDKELGLQLANLLEPYSPSRASIVVGLGREQVQWQHLSLPPAPIEDLPDMIQLQSEHEVSRGDKLTGFDFISLEGDEETPHKVLTVSIPAKKLKSIQAICEAAELRAARMIPLSFGWPALVQATDQEDGIFMSPLSQEATLWEVIDEKIVLYRQMHLPSIDELDGLSARVTSELRRTLMAISQKGETPPKTIRLVGSQAARLRNLSAMISENINVKVVPSLPLQDLNLEAALEEYQPLAPNVMPLIGLALQEAAGKVPPMDLLHPHRRPEEKSNRRTYMLAGAAALSVLLLFGWQAYSSLNAPLSAAAVAQEELDQINESLSAYSVTEQRMQQIRDWLNNSVDLMTELERISEKARPVPLRGEGFPLETDVVFTKLDFSGREVVIDGMARTSQALTPLEARLRNESHRVQRNKFTPEKNADLADYDWQFNATIEIGPGGATSQGAQP